MAWLACVCLVLLAPAVVLAVCGVSGGRRMLWWAYAVSALTLAAGLLYWSGSRMGVELFILFVLGVFLVQAVACLVFVVRRSAGALRGLHRTLVVLCVLSAVVCVVCAALVPDLRGDWPLLASFVGVTAYGASVYWFMASRVVLPGPGVDASLVPDAARAFRFSVLAVLGVAGLVALVFVVGAVVALCQGRL